MMIIEKNKNTIAPEIMTGTVVIDSPIRQRETNPISKDMLKNSLLRAISYDRTTITPLFLGIRDGFIDELVEKITSKSGKAILIGVAGESASGKSTLVMSSVKALEKRQHMVDNNLLTVVTGDNYFKDTSEELKKAGSFEALFQSGFNFDVPDALDLQLMRKHLLELAEGNKIKIPEYNFITCESIPEKNIKEPAKVIVAESLFTLNEKLRDVLDIAIYVYAPHEVLKERWFKRAASRGKTEKAAEILFDMVNKEAQRHIRPTKATADIIINGMATPEYIHLAARRVFSIIAQANA